MTSTSPTRIVQITDTHLFSDKTNTLLGCNTYDSFKAVVNLVKKTQGQPDYYVITGDIVHDHNPEAYQILADTLQPLCSKMLCIPGNHDELSYFEQLTQKGSLEYHPITTFDNWCLIALKSAIPNQVEGELGTDNLSQLKVWLDTYQHMNVAICLHHQPVLVGSEWLDGCGLMDGPELMALIEQYENVKLVFWGHVHQQFESRHQHIQLLSCPSTCIQFKPNSNNFALDTEQPPGYRIIDLYPDGHIETQVLRVEDYQSTVDAHSTGY